MPGPNYMSIDPRLLGLLPQMGPNRFQLPTLPPIGMGAYGTGVPGPSPAGPLGPIDQGAPPGQLPPQFSYLDMPVPGVMQPPAGSPPGTPSAPLAGPPSEMALGPMPQGSIGQMLAGMGKPAGVPPAPPAPAIPAAEAPPEAAKGETPAPPPNVDPSLWDKLMGDPDMRKTMLKVGLQMMQPIQPGQTPLGAGAAAASGGVDYLAGLKERQRMGALEERKTKATETTAEAQKTVAGREKETETDRALKASQAKEHGARADLLARSAGRGTTDKMPKTRAEFMQQANLLIAKSLPNFISAEDIVGAREQVKQMADELYGSGGGKETQLNESYKHPKGQTVSLTEIQAIAKSRNVTPEEVIRVLKLQ